jgi:hypothetical protein
MEGPETEMDNDDRSNVTSILHAYSLTLPVTQTQILDSSSPLLFNSLTELHESNVSSQYKFNTV